MPITESTRRVIWTISAGRCAICRSELLDDPSASADPVFLGQVAHIVGEEPGGPRGNGSLPLSERNERMNLLLLCQPHHTIIDRRAGEYSVEKLKSIKSAHETWVKNELSQCVAWNTELSSLSYINVPRLSILSANHGITVDLSAYGPIKALHSLGWELTAVMSSFQKILRKITPAALPLDKIAEPDQKYNGLICSVNHQFRTKNGPILGTFDVEKMVSTGNIEQDSHIYIKRNNYKLILPIEPRWITTATAFGDFRPMNGQTHFSGLCLIKSLDESAGLIIGTPLVLGHPLTELQRLLFGSSI